MTKHKTTIQLPDDLREVAEEYAEHPDRTMSDGVRHYMRRGVKNKQARADGGRAPVRYTFLELLTVTIMLATAMSYVLAFGTQLDLLTEALGLTGLSAVLLAVLFGQTVYETVSPREVGR